MNKGRLEAFSDGVLAIIITIMVLELRAPHGVEWSILRPLRPVLLSYVLSFVYIAIYWNNHHHLLQATKQIGGGVLWLIGEAYFRYSGQEGMGGGDVKMLAMIGAFLGWKLVLVTLVLQGMTLRNMSISNCS